MDCLKMGRSKQGGGGGLWLWRPLFALVLSQAQLHQYSRLGFGFPPVIDLADDGASSGSQSGGGMPWSLEESGLVPDTFSDIWALIERLGLDWSLLRCQPKPRIAFQPS